MAKKADFRTMTDDQFRQAVRDWLAEHERTQSWLAKKIGIKRQYLWQVMTGYDARGFTLQLREKVAEVFRGRS